MKFYEKHPKASAAITLVFYVLVGACCFPIYNLNREWPFSLTCSILFITVSLYVTLGGAEVMLFHQCGIQHILPLNLLLVLLGMGARYLLEFGEVSNTYNFTIPNMLLHIGATVVLSTLSWCWYKSHQGENKTREV